MARRIHPTPVDGALVQREMRIAALDVLSSIDWDVTHPPAISALARTTCGASFHRPLTDAEWDARLDGVVLLRIAGCSKSKKLAANASVRDILEAVFSMCQECNGLRATHLAGITRHGIVYIVSLVT